ncbi:hypothetical protein VTI74DRAFT_2637 [Chaetomium olivicolor]
MENAGKSDTPITWASWSPSFFPVNRTKIPRRFLQVPSDQQKLLNRPDAWLAGGVPNVPPKVLEDVRTHYGRRIESPSRAEREAPSSQPASPVRQHREPCSSEPPSPANNGRIALSSQPASPVQATSTPDGSTGRAGEMQEQGGMENDMSGTSIPWSRSPSAHLRPPCRQLEPTAAGTSTPHSSGEQEPGFAHRTMSPATFLKEFPPSSSLASDAGLEVEVPKAATEVVEPVNRTALTILEPSPPSAQVTIPSTLTSRTSLVPPAPEPKRRRPMKDPAAVFASPGSIAQKPAPRLGVAQIMNPAQPQHSTPVNSSSPPRLPAPMPSAIETPPAVPSVENDQMLRSSNPNPEDVVTATSHHANNQNSSNSTDKPPPNGPPSQVPFTAFKVAYPDYSGSPIDFVRALMCIKQLQKERALPEFLYDDFIQVFSSDYLDYITTLDDKQVPLRAIQWYNENVSRPLYTKGVVNKLNIMNILDQEEVKVKAIKRKLEQSETETESPAVRRALGMPKETDQLDPHPPCRRALAAVPLASDLAAPAASPAPGAATYKTEVASSASEQTKAPQPIPQTSESVVRPENDPAVSLPISVHRPSVPTAGSVNVAQDSIASKSRFLRTQVDSSFPEIERTQTPRIAQREQRAASTFPRIGPSQISNPDSIPETVLTRKVPPRPSALPEGHPRAPFKRPRAAVEEQNKRDLRWRKFLIQRGTQGSSPGHATPS